MQSTYREADTSDVFKGILAGVAGGLAGSWTMSQFQNIVSRMSSSDGQQADELKADELQADDPQTASEEAATIQAAEAISHGVANHHLTQREKKVAGPLMHYGFGALMGGVYGAAAEVLPAVKAGGGSGYGAAVWLGADEVAVPMLGLSDPPAEHAASTHGMALASHLVYGFTVEFVRSTVRRAM